MKWFMGLFTKKNVIKDWEVTVVQAGGLIYTRFNDGTKIIQDAVTGETIR